MALDHSCRACDRGPRRLVQPRSAPRARPPASDAQSSRGRARPRAPRPPRDRRSPRWRFRLLEVRGKDVLRLSCLTLSLRGPGTPRSPRAKEHPRSPQTKKETRHRSPPGHPTGPTKPVICTPHPPRLVGPSEHQDAALGSGSSDLGQCATPPRCLIESPRVLRSRFFVSQAALA